MVVYAILSCIIHFIKLVPQAFAIVTCIIWFWQLSCWLLHPVGFSGLMLWCCDFCQLSALTEIWVVFFPPYMKLAAKNLFGRRLGNLQSQSVIKHCLDARSYTWNLLHKFIRTFFSHPRLLLMHAASHEAPETTCGIWASYSGGWWQLLINTDSSPYADLVCPYGDSKSCVCKCSKQHILMYAGVR